MDVWCSNVYTEANECTSRAEDLGFCAASKTDRSPQRADLVAMATVVNITVPKNMAEAMVVSGAVSEAENMIAKKDKESSELLLMESTTEVLVALPPLNRINKT